jgi:hypothetical protein
MTDKDCCKSRNVEMISGVPVCKICLDGIGKVMAKAVKVSKRKMVIWLVKFFWMVGFFWKIWWDGTGTRSGGVSPPP